MRIACVQSDVTLGDVAHNIARASAQLEALSSRGVELAVFPEAFLTGYCIDSQSEAQRIAIDSSALTPLRQASDRVGVTVVVGFAERSADKVYNSAALIEPNEPLEIYRKTHLPELGLDRFVEPGDSLNVFDTRLGRIGVLICFDLRVPEAARVLALRGAELIVLPTNWPAGAQTSAEHVVIARAAENRVFFAACNRVGEENGFQFMGRSKIVGPSGKLLASAGSEEEVILADIDLAEARIKRNVIIPGKYETTVFESRRPELYRDLVPDDDESAMLPESPPVWV